MNYQNEINKIKDIVSSAKDVLIVTHERPTADSIGAALALYLGLTSMGKKVTIACPDPITVELSSFIGVNKIATEIGKKNFVISLDYVEGSIEKVSYNIEGNKFNLVIEPREGFESFSQEKIHFTNAGTSADVIFSIDTIHLGGLKKLYEAEKELYASKPIINIDRHPNNAQYGQINVIDAQASSTAEMIYGILSGLEIAMSQDISTNLLNALYGATNSFTNQNVTSQAFELAALCTKSGAKRFRRGGGQQQPQQNSEETPKEEKVVTEAEETFPMTQASTQETKMASPPIPEVKKTQEAPADWLKPKIFKSSNV